MESNDIKEYGLSIGYDKVGITSLDCLPRYVEEITSRGDMYSYFQKMMTKPVQKNFPEAKSIVVMVWDYFKQDFPQTLNEMVGKIYMARCYGSLPGSIEHARFELMDKFLQNNDCKTSSNTANVPARWVAAHAGVTNFGKNTFAYADGIGSYVVIHTILVDKEFSYDVPTMKCKCPPNCTECIDACPTKAIYEPFKLEPGKCIGFNNWMRQDGRGSLTSFIPYELRDNIGFKIHGCDICQDVCPRNQKKLKQKKPFDKFVEHIAPDITLTSMLNMSDDFYMHKIRPLMYNYIGDKRYFVRNAAIAIGNSKDEYYIHDLVTALNNNDEMIREYVVWALGKIGGQQAKNILEDSFLKETSENVKQAINRALTQF